MYVGLRKEVCIGIVKGYGRVRTLDELRNILITYDIDDKKIISLVFTFVHVFIATVLPFPLDFLPLHLLSLVLAIHLASGSSIG